MWPRCTQAESFLKRVRVSDNHPPCKAVVVAQTEPNKRCGEFPQTHFLRCSSMRGPKNAPSRSGPNQRLQAASLDVSGVLFPLICCNLSSVK